jgi:hypothetical protein
MEEIVRNIRDLDADERRACETVVGHVLRDDQQLVVRIVESPAVSQFDRGNGALPDWCDVYAGLSESEIAAIEIDVLDRPQVTRVSE